MAASLYVTSTQTFSGKSALCICLARRMQKEGVRVGYMKPISTGARLDAGLADEDAEYFRQAFTLPDSLEDMVPVGLAPRTVEAILRGADSTDFAGRLRAAYERLSGGRDLMFLEGGCNLREGSLVGLPAAEVAGMLGVRTLVVVKYEHDLQVMDDSLTSLNRFGTLLVGVVLNGVPRPHMPFAQETIKPDLEKRGIAVLGVLPHERLLSSVSVADLAEFLSGEVLCGRDKTDELVEHIMVGAMSVDSALAYFRRKPNKAVITGGDRPDIQLAALETSTKCLILTGNLRPSPIILGRAEEVGVPMLLVRQDTMTAVETIERYFGKTRFHQEKKVQRFDEMLADRFDCARLWTALGLR